jgi:N-acetylornithine carbamoyltransferase
MDYFNDLADFSADEISELITLARKLNEKPEPRALEGKVLSLLFLSPSLRTLVSFQSAMIRMGGGTFVVSPDMSIHGLESRSGIVMDGVAAEHIHEAVPVIASYGDAIGWEYLPTAESSYCPGPGIQGHCRWQYQQQRCIWLPCAGWMSRY